VCVKSEGKKKISMTGAHTCTVTSTVHTYDSLNHPWSTLQAASSEPNKPEKHRK
jgi:hypothetical protein